MGDIEEEEEEEEEKKDQPLKALKRLLQSCWIVDMASDGRMIVQTTTEERKMEE